MPREVRYKSKKPLPIQTKYLLQLFPHDGETNVEMKMSNDSNNCIFCQQLTWIQLWGRTSLQYQFVCIDCFPKYIKKYCDTCYKRLIKQLNEFKNREKVLQQNRIDQNRI